MQWLQSVGLKLASHKTEIVLVSNRKIVESARIRIGNTVVTSKRAIRYLGVIIDTRLSFREHLAHVQAKAVQSSRALARMTP